MQISPTGIIFSADPQSRKPLATLPVPKSSTIYSHSAKPDPKSESRIVTLKLLLCQDRSTGDLTEVEGLILSSTKLFSGSSRKKGTTK